MSAVALYLFMTSLSEFLFRLAISSFVNFFQIFLPSFGISSTFMKFMDNHQIDICLTSSTTLLASQNR